MAQRISRQLFDAVAKLLADGKTVREVTEQLPISHVKVYAIRDGKMARPDEPRPVKPLADRVFPSVPYRDVPKYRCDNGHTATTEPCVSCVALSATAKK